MRLRKKGATMHIVEAYFSLAIAERLLMLIRLVVLSLATISIGYPLNRSICYCFSRQILTQVLKEREANLANRLNADEATEATQKARAYEMERQNGVQPLRVFVEQVFKFMALVEQSLCSCSCDFSPLQFSAIIVLPANKFETHENVMSTTAAFLLLVLAVTTAAGTENMLERHVFVHILSSSEAFGVMTTKSHRAYDGDMRSLWTAHENQPPVAANAGFVSFSLLLYGILTPEFMLDMVVYGIFMVGCVLGSLTIAIFGFGE
ncbi:hypothetical protein TRIATDRAFT_88762 [Trichoderma atroviride IMI 206040]|uniref:Uncharacterized protein n=1 Tax=Hypocrea atroviridis (strain ATCC 20476 / IMI 206040) TaxID=452589 RepID=G9NUW8_HYPAI|nr:uncharacterized protein TRIATDRAFT_88762 [Trichoderma atroviride IMI 206040]EHK45843.1 hypothetical protein TRIATDRAFT_88762 [Trichoderma atroviride IMI 206040]